MRRYFIVSPSHSEDTVWNLCVTSSNRKCLLSIYQQDNYSTIASAGSKAEIIKYANKHVGLQNIELI